MPIGKIAGTSGKGADYSAGSVNITHATGQSKRTRMAQSRPHIFSTFLCTQCMPCWINFRRWKDRNWLLQVVSAAQLWSRCSERGGEDKCAQDKRKPRLLEERAGWAEPVRCGSGWCGECDQCTQDQTRRIGSSGEDERNGARQEGVRIVARTPAVTTNFLSSVRYCFTTTSLFTCTHAVYVVRTLFVYCVHS